MRLEQKPGGHSDGQNHCNCAHSCFHELPPGNTICASRLLGFPFLVSWSERQYTPCALRIEGFLPVLASALNVARIARAVKNPYVGKNKSQAAGASQAAFLRLS